MQKDKNRVKSEIKQVQKSERTSVN